MLLHRYENKTGLGSQNSTRESIVEAMALHMFLAFWHLDKTRLTSLIQWHRKEYQSPLITVSVYMFKEDRKYFSLYLIGGIQIIIVN